MSNHYPDFSGVFVIGLIAVPVAIVSTLAWVIVGVIWLFHHFTIVAR